LAQARQKAVMIDMKQKQQLEVSAPIRFMTCANIILNIYNRFIHTSHFQVVKLYRPPKADTMASRLRPVVGVVWLRVALVTPVSMKINV
jgi:hypothetical protein